MAKTAVLDATALMALLGGEPGAAIVADCLPWAVIGAVNLAEVQTRLVAAGMDEQIAWWHISELNCESVPFDGEQARIAGSLVRITRPLGLSSGDRACLALAIQRQAKAYTTDRAWKRLNLEIEIEVIR